MQCVTCGKTVYKSTIKENKISRNGFRCSGCSRPEADCLCNVSSKGRNKVSSDVEGAKLLLTKTKLANVKQSFTNCK
jgi:hypothetical protein